MKKKKLYTFICDYNSGTYLAQIESANIDEAKQKWALTVDFQLFNVPEEYREEFVKSIEEYDAVKVDNVKNVWCTSHSLKDELALIHIIDTTN